jgi:hypothetical protein
MVNVKAIVRVLFVIIALSLYSNLGYSDSPSTADPCQSKDVTKLSVSVSEHGGVSTTLVPSSGSSIHVCGFDLAGGFNFQFAYGSDCSAGISTSTDGINGRGINRWADREWSAILRSRHYLQGSGEERTLSASA